MANDLKIVLVGGGSYNWSPRLLNDIILCQELENSHIVLLDIDRQAAQEMNACAKAIAKFHGRKFTFTCTTNQRKAFDSADFVVITISTGGFDTMKHDLKVPEKYHIYQTVGDTSGPGGWSRSLRNVPVFAQMAEDLAECAPNAVVLNYTNPMATLTMTLARISGLRTVGLCHGLFECYSVLQNIFNVEESQIKARFGGVNHFFWIVDFTIDGRDGYELLNERVRKQGSFAKLVKKVYVDGAGFHSDKYLADELLKVYGYLPYVGDRHTCEFFPHYLTSEETLEKYKLVRTPISWRRQHRRKARKYTQDLATGKQEPPKTASRETAVDIIKACTLNQDFIDVVNVPNVGQISNLPAGAVVETLGQVNSLGFQPISCGPLPPQIQELVYPHAAIQEPIVEASLSGNFELAVQALRQDPLCSHLLPGQVEKMAQELIRANKDYLPQFA